jgi:serine/threonine protein kinase/tetratricopeptide (TPR) repeat protein
VKADDPALADVAASVADGTPVDWHGAELAARNQRLVRHLRLVEKIATLHRSIPASEGDLPAPIPTPPDGRRWGRLVLLESIGKGASCDVHRAWDSELHRDVALKLLHDDGSGDAHARMLEEARRLARLRHEHVVQVYGAERHDDRVGLWMELVRGTSLDEIVRRHGPFGAREAALVGLDVCSALAAVHGAGLLHRDVKAQNVMREAGGRIVLMDFGTGEELAGTNRMIGTPLYLAPEIFQGQKASVQSDLYSLGVLLFYLVTGKFPVAAGSMEQLARAHASGERQPLRDLRPDISEAFIRVVERALDSDPVRRYRSVGDLERALRESLDPTPAVVPTPPVSERPVSTGASARRRLRAVFVVAAVSLLLLAAAFVSWMRLAAPAGGPTATRVAVLPFRNVSPSSAAPYLADELTDQLISTLGQIGSLQVTSLTSVLPFRDHSATIPEIGQKLRVDDVVEATLLVVPDQNGRPDRVRVNARLISAGTDTQIWAQTFERSLGDTLALQADIARAIAEGIRAVLTPEERNRLQQTIATTSAANDAYFQGQHFLSQSGSDGLRAVEAFRRATELDPQHAGARAGLARGLLTLASIGAMTHAEARSLALAEANRAIAVEPDSGEVHAVLADLHFYYDWDWVGADRSYRRAIALNSSFARARSQYARYLAAARRSQQSVAEAARAVELDPMSASAVSTKALMLYYARDYSGAFAAIQQAIQLEPGSGSAYFVLARIESGRNATDHAIVANERALELAGDNAATGWRTHLIRLQALAGAQNEARAALERLPASIASKHQRISNTQLALVHLALGDRTATLDLLERATDERDPDLLWLGVDPRVDALRGDPRFERVLMRIGVPR